MKKIASVLIILLMACCFVFATEAIVELNGTVPEGYTGGDDEPVAQNGGLKLIMKVVTSTFAESSDPTSYQDGTDAGSEIKNVDIVHAEIGNKINSLYIAFGAYGNVPKDDNTASLDVTVTSDGWKDSSDTAEGTLTLTPTTKEKTNSDKLFTGAVGTEGVSFSVNTSTSYSGDSRIVEQKDAILVGVSQVRWGLAGTEIPPTGKYTGTITITITGDDGATI
ncbi:MAG: hypothetical protein IAC42_09485 [Spirochaetes bacterium]|uniref:Uncharacterized protein n=1 Tax=Candidatus Aphodenecus pullistercoris TaxID=2840669 RepID=A0A9D9EAD0_9SPIR|nr:hypothetical protein [Candidatus Aphodenecus pullistercoris]